MVGSLFYIFVSFLGSVYVAKKITGEIAKTSIFAAIINISINFLLIRFIGLYAASMATAVSYIAMFVYRFVDSRKYIRLRLDGKLVTVMGLSYALSILVYYINRPVLSLTWALVMAVTMLLINKKTFLFLLDFLRAKGK
jgi:O-antigen/teichoic acid export membrane protein